MLEISNLSKSFGRHEVLRAVSLTLRPGSIHGLVGANGAGKTTLINCLYGLESGFTGLVRLTDAPGVAVRERTGLLSYEPYFYPRLTGREYVGFCWQARGRRGPVPALAGWTTLLELPLDQYAEEYSAGMKKKLALLALVVQDLPYLILDEPFNGLDLEANLLLRELLRGLRGRGTGILLTSHLLSALTEIADEATVLVAGQPGQRHYPATDFTRLEADLLAGLHQQKLGQLRTLLG